MILFSDVELMLCQVPLRLLGFHSWKCIITILELHSLLKLQALFSNIGLVVYTSGFS